jgi:hypothetical protein
MWRPLKFVTVVAAGTPIRATVNESVPATRFPAHSILFQQHASNTGKIWVLDRVGANKTTGEGVLAVLPAPTSSTLPSATCTVSVQMNAFNVADFWIDADVSGEKCLVSAIRA